jgi:hypothetical protein
MYYVNVCKKRQFIMLFRVLQSAEPSDTERQRETTTRADHIRPLDRFHTSDIIRRP